MVWNGSTNTTAPRNLGTDHTGLVRMGGRYFRDAEELFKIRLAKVSPRLCSGSVSIQSKFQT